MIATREGPGIVHYLPIATTILSAVFFGVLARRYVRRRSGPHLLWWAAGVLFYGTGTALEAAVTLWGNTPALNKAWYIAGTLFGGYPLAQGTVYLLLARRAARALTWATLPVVAVLTCLVILSPTRTDVLLAHKPGGDALGWQWIRPLTPLINLYAASFLIGGAAFSAWRYWRRHEDLHRAVGNALIALGALLPGAGGALAKAGVVEALYIGEFAGLLFISSGYSACVRRPAGRTVTTDLSRSAAAQYPRAAGA